MNGWEDWDDDAIKFALHEYGYHLSNRGDGVGPIIKPPTPTLSRTCIG